jgi:hypothetical protein
MAWVARAMLNAAAILLLARGDARHLVAPTAPDAVWFNKASPSLCGRC